MSGSRHHSMLLLLAVLTPAAASAPGPPAAADACVEDPVADATHRLAPNPEFPGQATRHDELPDVDGDGRAESLVTFRDLCGARNCTWAVYLSGRGCQAYGGAIEAAAWRRLPTRRYGVRDLLAIWVAGCAGAERYETVWRYDGREYREARRQYVDTCGSRR